MMEHPIGKETHLKRPFNWRQFAGASLKALKPHVQPSIIMPVLVGMVVTMRRLPEGREWFVLWSVFFFYSGAVSALNDFLDRERDAINHPDRLFVNDIIPSRLYLTIFVGAFVLISLILLISVTPIPVFLNLMLIYALIEGLHLLYATVPNLGFNGFVRQSLLCIGPMLLVLFGSLAVGSPSTELLFVAPAVGLFFGFGIIGKDIADMIGDRTTGLVTLPISLGIRAAGWISGIGHIFAFALIAWLVFGGMLSKLAFPFLIVAALMVIFSTAYFIRGEYGRYWGIPMLVGFISQLVFELGIIIGATAA